MKQKPYLIVLYGKENCPHCHDLYQLTEEVLQEYTESFSFRYENLSSIAGLVAYAKAETINGQRIPALQIFKYNESEKEYQKIRDPRTECFNPTRETFFCPTFLQVQTDYSQHHYIEKLDIEELILLAQTGKND